MALVLLLLAAAVLSLAALDKPVPGFLGPVIGPLKNIGKSLGTSGPVRKRSAGPESEEGAEKAVPSDAGATTVKGE